MGDRPTIVVDTNVLLNLATPVVDGRPDSPSGEDPFLTVLTAYDVHVPQQVLGEITSAQGSGDLLSAAADAVMQASHRLTTHDVESQVSESLEYGLDPGESLCIWLANEISPEMFVTDEFNSSNYLLISLSLDDTNILFTTPHVLCRLGAEGLLDKNYVSNLLTYMVRTKGWDSLYINQLRSKYLY